MKYVTPESGPQIEGPETPSEGLSEGPHSVEELASALAVMDVLRHVPAKTPPAIAQRVVELGWVYRDEVKVAEARAELHHSNLLQQWDRADAAEAEVDRLQDQLAVMVKPRAWTYARGEWLRYWPFAVGNDEFCRRTLVLGNRWTGAVVIALWQLNDPECPECIARKAD